MNAAIAVYEDIAAATARMLESAQRADWDGLVAAEAQCAAHIERARALDTAPLGVEERQAKARLIRRMLAHDAEIRTCVQPWMKRVEELLATSARRTRAEDFYRNAAGEP